MAEVARAVEEPANLQCPITHLMFRDPVMTLGGRTYERSAIRKYWKQQKQPWDPLTGVLLESNLLISNFDKRTEVQDFLDYHQDYVPEGWKNRGVPAPVLAKNSGKGKKKLRSEGMASLFCLFAAFCLCSTFACLAFELHLLEIVSILFASRQSRYLVQHEGPGIFKKQDAFRSIVMLLNMYRHSDSVRKSGMEFLGHLAAISSTSQDELLEAGVIPTILEGLKLHASSDAVQQNAMGLIWHLSTSSSAAADFEGKHAMEVILKNMKLHMTVEAVQRNGMGAVLGLALLLPGELEAAREMALTVILEGLEHHKSSENVQRSGMALISRLAATWPRHSANISNFAVSDTASRILEGMLGHKSAETVQRRGLEAISGLARVGIQDALVDADALPIIVNALQTYSNSEEVQELGMAALAELASSANHREGIVLAGSLPIIAASVERYPRSEAVQQQGMRILRILAEDDATRSSVVEIARGRFWDTLSS